MRRKILLPAFFYASGILTFVNAIYEINYCILILCIIAIIYSCFYLMKELKIQRAYIVFLLFIFLISIFNSFFCYYFSFGSLDSFTLGQNKFILRIDKATYEQGNINGEGEVLLVNDEEIAWQPRIKVNIYNQPNSTNILDDQILIYGKLEIPKANSNPHCFNYKNFLLSKGIKYTLSCNSYIMIADSNTVKSQLCNLKDQFLEEMRESIGEKNTAFIKGVCFGDKSDIDEDSLRYFQENGTAHILAVSGLHIGLIYMILKRLFYKNHRLLFYISSIFIIISYGIITQWSISVVRASLLIATNCLAFVLEKPYDLTSGTVFVGLLILLDNPFQLLSVGFHMSFLAVLSIPFFGGRIKELLKILFGERKFLDTIATALSIQLGLGFYTAYVFNYFSPLSFLLNIPTVFIISYLVPMAIVQFIIHTLMGTIPLIKVTDFMCECLRWVNQLGWAGGKGTMLIESGNSIIIGILILLIFFLFSEFCSITLFRREKKKMAMAIVLIFLVSLPIFYNQDDRFNSADLIFLDVGQGDCLHLRTKGQNYLIDGGGKVDYNLGQKVLKPYLLKNRAGGIDGAIATHNHSDHFLGLCNLSEELEIKDGFISSGYLDQREKITRDFKCDNYYYINNENKIVIDKDIWIEILWPNKGSRLIDESDENSVSLVMMIHYGPIKILVTGDIDEDCEKALMKIHRGTGRLKADILKVAHHGSKHSTCQEFIREVEPKVSIISVGKNNYGHPSEEVIERLTKAGSKVYRTDIDGAIGIEIKRNSLKLLTQFKQ